MSPSPEGRFYFHAKPRLSGQFIVPLRSIEAQASISLPTIGGHDTTG